MPEPDDLQPGGKDPAEGPRGPAAAEDGQHPEESHLGEGGDPAEGAD